MADDVETITLQHVDVAINLQLLFSNNTEMMTRFCECSPGGANSSSAHCHLVNDYNITLAELCDDQHQQHVIQVNVPYGSVHSISCCYAVLPQWPHHVRSMYKHLYRVL